MKFLIFIAPKDFKDESVSLVKLFFDKWGIKYDISSYTYSECRGTHGVVYKPAVHTSKVTSTGYDGVVLIDGSGIDTYKLCDYRPLLDLMYNFHNNKKYIIGIGNATKITARANIVNGKKVSTDDEESLRLVKLFHGVPSDESFEVSGNLITIKNSKEIEDSMIKILENMGVN
jgi:putative intracellular protease/amidase